MISENLKRMIELADKVFSVKDDPAQLNVTPEVMDKLKLLHPSCISDMDYGEGPVAWLLLIPTTKEIMQKFVSGQINENELFEETKPGMKFDAIYLCSALVLEEYRRKGIIKQLALESISNIRKDYPIKYLFSWPFSEEGRKTAENISELIRLNLINKKTKE